MDLSPESILFFNISNLVFISFQILFLIVYFAFYKRSYYLIATILQLSINFSFIIYVLFENYKSYMHLKGFYYDSVPLINILGAIEFTQMFYIFEAIILFSSLLSIYIFFKNCYLKNVNLTRCSTRPLR